MAKAKAGDTTDHGNVVICCCRMLPCALPGLPPASHLYAFTRIDAVCDVQVHKLSGQLSSCSQAVNHLHAVQRELHLSKHLQDCAAGVVIDMEGSSMLGAFASVTIPGIQGMLAVSCKQGHSRQHMLRCIAVIATYEVHKPTSDTYFVTRWRTADCCAAAPHLQVCRHVPAAQQPQQHLICQHGCVLH